MEKYVTAVILVVAINLVSACTTMDSTTQSSRYTFVDTAAAKDLFDRDVLFIDLRTKVRYDDGHIPGAVNLTWGRWFSEARLASVADKDQPLVIYCYGMHCQLSDLATEKAVTWGYTEVHYYMKGFPAWWDAGYPVEKSAS